MGKEAVLLRRWTAVLTALVLALALWAPISRAQAPIRVFVDGRPISFDVPPEVVNGRTLVPLRAIFEALGATVAWDQPTQTAKATWAGGELSLPIGAEVAMVNGQEKKLDVPGQLIGGRTMVPLRFVGETLGAQVGWYGNARLITINKPVKALVSATVTRVVDGDTVEVTTAAGVTEKVRLIGVDTPETVHPEKGVEPGGPEASAFTKERLTGQTVQLELDAEERDQYGRMLAYVYTANGAMFNAVLADEGHARMATFPPNVRYVEVFRALQADAEAAGRGLWPEKSTKWSLPVPPTGEPELTTVCDDFDPDPAKHCNKPAVLPGADGLYRIGNYVGPYNPFGLDKDCSDFKRRADAQAFFEAAGGPGKDPHKLDSDHDGVACETLP